MSKGQSDQLWVRPKDILAKYRLYISALEHLCSFGTYKQCRPRDASTGSIKFIFSDMITIKIQSFFLVVPECRGD